MQKQKEIKHFTMENAAGSAYDGAWEQVVEEYLKNGYKEKGKEAEIVAEGTHYKVLNRGEVTAFYDVSGNTLFDVENKRLEMEYERLIDGGVADVITYATGEEKLQEEENQMLESVKAEYKEAMRAQLDLLFQELIEQTKHDPEFEKKVLLTHKSMERCMKFCSEKAMGLRAPSDKEKAAARNQNMPIVTPVGSDMLFEWIKEYYDKDDKAEVEKEKKADTAQKKSADKKKEAATKETVSEKQEKKPVEKKEDTKAAGSPKKQDKSVDGQISMFDLFGV